MSELQRRLDEALHTLDAIQNGSVDAVVVNGPRGAQLFTLESPDHPFRTFVEGMQEGALTLASDGQILYANAFFAGLVGRPANEVVGAELASFVAAPHRGSVALLVEQGLHGTVKHTLRVAWAAADRARACPPRVVDHRWTTWSTAASSRPVTAAPSRRAARR